MVYHDSAYRTLCMYASRLLLSCFRRSLNLLQIEMAQVQQHLKVASLRWQKLVISEKVSCPTLETNSLIRVLQFRVQTEARRIRGEAVGNGKGNGVNWNLLNRNRQQHKQGYIFYHTRYTPRRGAPKARRAGGVHPANLKPHARGPECADVQG